MFRSIRIAALLAAAVAAPAAAQDYRAAVAATDPLASFQLDRPNAPADIGGYATSWQNVTQGTGAPLASVPANTGAAFDGTGAVSVVDTGLPGMIPGRGSINIWINLAQLPSLAGRVFALAGEAQGGNDFDFQINPDNRLAFYVGPGQLLDAGGIDASWIGQWHMLTAAYDGTIDGGQDTQALFIDGVRVAFRNADLSDSGHSSAFTIGYNSVFGGREFAGLVDEVAVWDRALSAAEVSGLYAARLNAASPGGVPEPATWVSMLMGLGAAGTVLRRRSPRGLAAA